VIGLLLRYPDKFDMISENILYREYLWDDIKKLISEWVDVISNFEIEKKNKYLALAQSDEMLQIKAQLEWDHIVQNEEKILQNIQKTTEKLNQDTLKKLESNLKERIKNGDMEALLEYNTIMKGKKK
jgi:phage-related minor tail protein